MFKIYLFIKLKFINNIYYIIYELVILNFIRLFFKTEIHLK